MIPDLGALASKLASRERHTLPPAERGRAGVLIALYGDGPDFRVLYTVRTERVEHHKGEISFPGGAYDPKDETLVQTALREAFEEIGVHTRDVSIVGLLDDLVTISQFTVTPVVARVERHPYEFAPYQPEVDLLLQVPLSHLADPANRAAHPRPHSVPAPAYRFGEHLIWGATARMTTHFLDILRLP